MDNECVEDGKVDGARVDVVVPVVSVVLVVVVVDFVVVALVVVVVVVVDVVEVVVKCRLSIHLTFINGTVTGFSKNKEGKNYKQFRVVVFIKNNN